MVKKRITYYGTVEGKEEKIYFRHLSALINQSDVSTKIVYFDFNNAFGGSPLSVAKSVNRSAIQDVLFEQNRVVAIYDYDFKSSDFLKADCYCKNNQINNYYSIVNFDLWLLNHKNRYLKRVSKSDDYVTEIRKSFSLKVDEDIKKESVIYKIVNQICLEDILKAIENAKFIEKQNSVCKNILDKTSNIYDQPNLQIAKFVEKVLKECNLIPK